MESDADPVLRHSAHGRLTVVPENYAVLVTDLGASVVRDELSVKVLGLLEVPMKRSEVLQHAIDRAWATHEEVASALQRLTARSFIHEMDTDSEPTPTDRYRVWWRPNSARVTVRTVGDVPGEQVRDALVELGMECTFDAEGDLAVVVADDYLNPNLAGVVEDQEPTLLVQLAGPRPTIGPWLGPGGPCIECLQARLRFNRSRELALLRERESGAVARGWTRSSAHHGAAEAAWEAHRYAAGRRRVTGRSTMTVIHHSSGERKEHAVVRRPQCARCGEQLTLEARHWDVQIPETQLKALPDGSSRAMTAEETLDRYRHIVSSRTGVVEYLTEVDPSDNPIHVVESGTNHATVRQGEGNQGFRQRAGGKGTTRAQAQAGALAEAIERFSAVYTGEQPVLRSSLAELADSAIDPRTMLLFSEKQYEHRQSMNSSTDAHRFIPERFDPEQELDFAPGWSISRQERRWVPAPLVYYGYSLEAGVRWGAADSNGNASGTSMADAIEQGFYELVERDSVALWWYNRVSRPGIDLESVADVEKDPYALRLRDYYRDELDRDIALLDVTSDTGVPAVVAVSRARSGRPRVMLGFGSHYRPTVAVNRAITELNQFLRMSHSLDRTEGAGDSTVAKWWRLEDLTGHEYLEPTHLTSIEQLPIPEVFVPGSDGLVDGREIVRACDAAAQLIGSELVVVNLTQPDVGMPVVKVIVPGLRHFWARFAPGRLYDTPVDLGWIKAPHTEESLNPTPIFW